MIRLDIPPANDNGAAAPATLDEEPIVSIPGDRLEHAYACSGNLILPLRFARRLPGWQLPPLSAS